MTEQIKEVERTQKFATDLIKVTDYIKEKNKVTFEEVIHYAKEELKITEKNYVVDIIKNLKDNFIIAELNKNIIYIQDIDFTEKYIQSNINNFVWISDQDKSNQYGIAFDPSFELISVANKKDVPLKSKWEGKIIEDEGVKTFIAIKCAEIYESHLLITPDERGHYRILNNQVGLYIEHDLLKEQLERFSQEKQIPLDKNSVFKISAGVNGFEIIELFGKMSDKGIEAKIIHELIDFKKNKTSYEVKNQDIKVSADLENIAIITIDALSTKDRDDALGAQYTYDENNQKNGYELYVCIANVSKYIQKNDEQDLQAQELTSSVYLANKTVHMLNDDLAQNVGSLNPGVVRDTLYMKAKFNLEGQLISSEFKEGGLKSSGAITYDDVDRILKGSNPIESTIGQVNLNELEFSEFDVMLKLKNIQKEYSKIEKNIHILNELNHAIDQTPERKYWFVDSPEYKIGENGKIESLYLDKRDVMDSHKIVENMMKITNIQAAKMIEENFPKLGLYRNQISPLREEVDDMSVSIKPKSAFYSQENQGHWALNQAQYVHFTSPLRRLSDLVQHRVVRAIINHEQAPYTEKEMESLSEKINYKQYVYKQAYIKEENLLMPQYISYLVETKKISNRYEIVDVTDRGLVIRNKQLIEHFIPHFKVDKLISKKIQPILGQLSQTKDENASMTVNEKMSLIKSLNKDFDLKGNLDNYHWLSERKQIQYRVYTRNDDMNHPDNPNKERKMRM